MPKHIQPDQEPTPIDCQIFKELANQPLGLPATPLQQRRGALYRPFNFRQAVSVRKKQHPKKSKPP
jgi:hypothetical protein